MGASKKKEMTYLAWSEQLVVGQDAMDRDHRRLLDLLNQSIAALQNSDALLFEETMERLARHASAHFEHEESLMRVSGAEQMEPHVHHHRAVAAQLEAFSVAVGQGILSPGQDAALFLYDWLLEHIVKFDKPLADHLRCRSDTEQAHDQRAIAPYEVSEQ